jgi:SAM-dependent methyltransferase
MSDVPFDTWARFYDAALPADRPDRPLFVELGREADGPVLELGCGTGDVYLELLAAGVDAHGIDLSGEMLDVLERKAVARGLEPRVRRADVADFAFEIGFDLVIAPLNVVRHVVDLADQRAAFRNVFDALEPDGRFVFWVDLPDLDEVCEQRDGTTTNRRFTHEDREYDLAIRIELRDPIEQTLTYSFAYTDAETGDAVASMAFEMALVPKRQFELLLADAGFDRWTFYNGAELDPLSTASEPAVCLAER